MEEFDISYRVIREKEYPEASLVAQLVPGERPDNIEKFWDKYEIKNQLKQVCCIIDTKSRKPAIAEGIMIQLIVRLHKYSLGKEKFYDSCHWQTGIVLDNTYNGRAFLEILNDDINVTVKAVYPERFMSIICDEINWLITQYWKGLKIR